MKTRKWIIGAIAVWLLVSLACNIPYNQPVSGLSPADLRSTLQALQESWPTELVLPENANQPPATPLVGLATATSDSSAAAPFPEPRAPAPPGSLTYHAQSGDTLKAVSARFGVPDGEITSNEPIPSEAFIRPGQVLWIPDVLGNARYPSAVLPDSEIVYSPSTLGFSIDDTIRVSGGFLSNYQETVNQDVLSGAQIVHRVADLTSTNPRFLLALIEFRSGWVRDPAPAHRNTAQPIGFNIQGQEGLYKELSIAANQLNRGYYGWRDGSMLTIKYPNGETVRLSPALNAGSVAVQRIFSFFYRPGDWEKKLYGPGGFTELYQDMFGDPWERAAVVEPLFPAGLTQPPLELPFLPGERWALTGGPHYSWNAGSPRGALDFSPVTGKSGCYVAPSWSTAVADGVVVRDGEGILMLDLDGDGYEQTGWVLFYLHLAASGRKPVGSQVYKDDELGHPSCEGGITTGTHLHLARKYNGEWLPADGAIPFVLGGWQAKAGAKNYSGYLFKDGQIVSANPGGTRTSIIVR
jgi:LasA protease